jgi:hypothetical protein
MNLIASRLPERKAARSSWVRREKWSSAAFLASLDDALPTAAPALAQGALASVLFFALYASLARKWILTEDGIDGGGGDDDDEQARGEDDGRDDPDDASVRTKVYVFCFAASVVSAGLLAPATTATASHAVTFESLLVGALVAAAASAAAATGFTPTSAMPESTTRTKPEAPAGAELSATPTGAGGLGEEDDDDEATAAWRSAEQALLERWDDELRGRPSSDPRRPP